MFELPAIDVTIATALAEDLGVDATALLAGQLGPALLARDVTSEPILGVGASYAGVIVAREECVVAGLPVAARAFEHISEFAHLDEPIEMFPLLAEGAHVAAGTAVAEVSGQALAVLVAERTALDFLMLLSGMATTSAAWVAAAGTSLTVCDTRKTLPGLRELSKYATRVGGARNHRSGLHDMVLVKDNHLANVAVTDAVNLARTAHPDLEIEVEADTTEQALQAIVAGADAVLLDNLRGSELERAVTACRVAADDRGRPVIIEASGGIGIEDLPEIARAGVDRVSSSALTMALPIDFGLDATVIDYGS
jgi:nicotinate-nucleotide pyrophosphorylase (carboxylating)